MPLVDAKCTNCGSVLKVDKLKEAAICEYCGSVFVIEKAIQNYNYYVTNNINADSVFVSGKGNAEKERLLKNAKTNEQFKDYKKATEIYQQVVEDYPNEYRGWLGLSLIISNSFNNLDVSFKEFENLSSYMNKCMLCAPSEQVDSIKLRWNTYLKKHTSFINQQKSKISKLQIQKNTIENQIEITNRNMDECQNKIDSISSN